MTQRRPLGNNLSPSTARAAGWIKTLVVVVVVVVGRATHARRARRARRAKMASEDLDALERMIADRERALVEEHVTSAFTALRIAYDAREVPAGGAIVLGSPAPIVVDGGHMKEFAGRAFHERARVKCGLSAVCEKELARKASIAALDEQAMDDSGVDFSAPEYKMKKTKRRGNKEFADHYGALGLALVRYRATKQQIMEQHKYLTIQLHPDKCGIAQADDAGKEKIEQRFKAVLTAMETLTDKNRRREFDSVDAPDFDFPSECKEGEFFETFMPHFHLLERFSETQPVPICDDPDASAEDVRKHYIFWGAKFKSWREFPHEKEDDVETAHDRNHRRHIERENQRLRAEEKKKETAKIRAFVEAAQKYDPRCIKQRAEEKAQREARRLGRTASSVKIQEEEAAAKAAEEAAKVDKASAKKELEKNKKALRKEKQRLRALAASAEGWVDMPADHIVEALCEAMSVEKLADVKALCDAISDGENPKGPFDVVAGILGACAAELGGDWAAKAEEAAARRAEREASEKVSGAAWKDDEVAALEKGAKQLHPIGTDNRWDAIAAHMAAEGKTRNAMDCMTKFRTMSA